MRIEWKGIPEGYWPNTEKPWRVSWGFGAHRDFALEIDAWNYHEELMREQKGDWKKLINEPFDVIALTSENLHEKGVHRDFRFKRLSTGEWILAEA